MVRAFALAGGRQQEPEYFENLGVSDDFVLVDSVGAERFQLTQQQCAGADVDWAEISQQPEREALERHRRRFHDCPTAELARRALVSLIGSSEVATPVLPAGPKQIDDCDRLAASDSDPVPPARGSRGWRSTRSTSTRRPQACEKSIQRNSRIIRFLFNLGRAKFAAANAVRLDDPARKPLIVDARAAYNDAANRGYVAALYSLATLSDYADADDEEQARANELLLKAANQEFPLAMYELGRRYSRGAFGLQRDLAEAYRWMSKAAESGSIPAMVETANALFYGRGVAQNPRRAVEWAQRAADSGSDVAKLNLGMVLFRRLQDLRQCRRTRVLEPASRPDPGPALVGPRRRRQQSDRAVQHGAPDGARLSGCPVRSRRSPSVTTGLLRMAATKMRKSNWRDG